jgi:hypothetical protein
VKVQGLRTETGTRIEKKSKGKNQKAKVKKEKN